MEFLKCAFLFVLFKNDALLIKSIYLIYSFIQPFLFILQNKMKTQSVQQFVLVTLALFAFVALASCKPRDFSDEHDSRERSSEEFFGGLHRPNGPSPNIHRHTRNAVFRQVTVGGKLVKWAEYCQINNAKSIAGPFYNLRDDREIESCASECVSNPDCTHFYVYDEPTEHCYLYNSRTSSKNNPLTIDTVFDDDHECGFVVDRAT